MRFLIFLIASSAFAAITNVAHVGSTQTQIGIGYTAPTADPCTVEVSKSSTYSPLAVDVDTTLFSGSNLDSRTGSLTMGRNRIFVAGKQGPAAIGTASNGRNYSRALQADTRYYFRITCGVDTATIGANTANLVMGDSRGEPLAVEAPYKYKRVTTNPVLMPSFVDPYTGVLTRNVAELFGWGWIASTAKSNIDADCNQTLTGFDSSCKFDEAYGTNWSFTSTSLTTAVRADDSNYAEYSGTTRDWLVVRLGTPRLGYTSSLDTVDHTLSFQNIGLRGKTSTTAGDGEEIETCLDIDIGDDNDCDSPILTTSLTTSDSTIRICADSPCTTADNPGDWMTYESPMFRTALSKSRMYNVAGSLTTMRLVGDDAVTDCNRMQASASEKFYIYKLSANTGYVFTVTAKDCAASPPTFTVTETGIDLTHNGTRGVGWYRVVGINSENYALRIRKKSTTSGSTISIGYVLWRAAWTHKNYLQDKSGGFGQNCQIVPTAEGYYLCVMPQGVVGIKPNAAGDGYDYKFYGTIWVSPQYAPGAPIAGLASQNTICKPYKTSYALWDLTTPGKLYCNLQSTYPNHYKAGSPVDNRIVLVAIQMSLVERTGLDPDDSVTTAGLSPQIGISSITVLTPCINSCSSTADDFTPFGQAMKFTASWTDPLVPYDTRWGSPGFGVMLDSKTLHGGVSVGNQETSGWSFAFDLGNGLPIGAGYVGTNGNTQQIIAAMQYDNNAAGRHCAIHTEHKPISTTGSPWTMPEVSDSNPSTFYSTQVGSLAACNTSSQNPASQTCGSCSSLVDSGNRVLDGYDYTGTNLCSVINLTSTWPSGTPHSLWEAGDPVNASGVSGNSTFYFSQKWRRGDFMGRSGELVRIIQRNSATQYVVVRGWGTMAAGGSAPSHADGVSWGTVCYNRRSGAPTQDMTEVKGSIVWYPLLDPNGGMDPNYTFLSDAHNHAFQSIGYISFDKWKIGKFDFSDTAAHKALFQTKAYTDMRVAEVGSAFAGQGAFVLGNGVEYHPGAQHVLDTQTLWFHDINPRLFHNGATYGTTWTLVAGKNSIFQQGGAGAGYVDPKHFDIDGFADKFPLKITDTLTDDSAGRGYFCVAIVANDCFSGSSAGGVYMSADNYDTGFNGSGSQKGCFESEFGGQGIDGCIGNTGQTGMTQTVFPAGNEGTVRGTLNTRVIKLEGMVARPAATINAMSDPLGFAIMPRDMPQIVIPPRIMTRSVAFSTFRAIPVSSGSLVPPGTSTALIQFGYDGTFQCSRNRTNTCYAESAALNETTPFRFDHETLTGVSCGSGCTVTIPAIANRVLYWRWVFRNAGGTIISRGTTNMEFVN